MLVQKQTRNEYQKLIQPHREKFQEYFAQLEKKLSSDPVLPELFMIYWTVLSAGLTGPIPHYLRSAGEKCREKGLPEMAEFFFEHCEEEDGHDGWAKKDTEKLVVRWNKRHPQLVLDTEELLSQKDSPAVKRYHEMHEKFIFGEAPYGELAIDVEIELITVKYGPKFLLKCIAKMGPGIIFDMSFLREHVRFDFGHTDKNFDVIHRLLEQHPEFLEHLVDAGRGGLETYAGFLGDVMRYSEEKAALLRNKSK
jgi:hypothetical protein